MQSVLRKGQTVYTADGMRLGSVLQCDSQCIVVGRHSWTSDHVVLALEDVAASGPDQLILRARAAEIRPETARPWPHAPDASGNANGVDLEPLRAGMREIEEDLASLTGSPPRTDEDVAPREPERLLLPSPDDARALERARIARLDAEAERCLVGEIGDFELGAACALPTPARAASEAPREPVS